MGIGIVLLFWLIVGAVAAVIGASILRGTTAALTRGLEGRERVIRMATRIPVAGLLWWIVVFVSQAAINEGVFHTDPGIGDSWHVLLPNGYVLGMIDVTDRAFVFNPKTVPPDSMVGQDDNIGDVAGLLVSGPYLSGSLTADNHYNNARFFLIDTRTGKRQLFSSNIALATALKPLGIRADFAPVAEVYSRHRNGWFNDLVLLLFAGFPVAGLGLLAYRIRVLRNAKKAPSV